MVQTFSPILLIEVEYDQHKYGSCLHYVCGERRKDPHASARLPHLARAFYGVAKGAGT